MATNANRITIAGRARLYLAPPGTAAPALADDPMPAGWVEAGYTTEDGTSFTTDPTNAAVRSHQSDSPTRRFRTGVDQALNADLQEWSADNFMAVFGGGTITALTVAAGAAPQYRYDPPTSTALRTVSACLEVVDGTKRYRWVAPKSQQEEGVDLGLPKGEEATLPLRLALLGSDLASPWYLLTNDPAFAAATL